MPFEPSRADSIKKAIRANFDASPDAYDAFEEAAGLFSFLTAELANEAGLKVGKWVLDVGCGTGLSTMVLLRLVGETGNVTGVDLSPGMLGLARRRCAGLGNVDFIEGDAERLGELVGGRSYDAVLYNACVFLLPDTAASLKGAFAVLAPGGTVAMDFIGGAHVGGQELFTELFPKWCGAGFPAPRFPADTARLGTLLSETGFKDIRSGTIEKPMTLDHLERFYGVPAQSASLYPRLAQTERKQAVERMFQQARERGVRAATMHWKWLTGKKWECAPGPVIPR